MKNPAKFWDNIAAKYAKSPISDMEAYTETLERTKSYLSPDDRVLEVGCGTGSTAFLLAESAKHITASDLSGAMIRIGVEKAKEQGISNVTLIKADLFGKTIDNTKDAIIENGPYDVILAFNLLHLLEDAPAAIKRIHALLKPDGLFISKTTCLAGSGTPFKFRMIMMILPLMKWLGKAPYVNFLKIAEFEDLILTGGFKIIETGNYPASPPNRFIVARKV